MLTNRLLAAVLLRVVLLPVFCLALVAQTVIPSPRLSPPAPCNDAQAHPEFRQLDFWLESGRSSVRRRWARAACS